MNETDIRITGMTCSGCVASIIKVLEREPGVAQVDVSLEQGRAHVRFDEARTSLPQLRQAIENAGYGVA